MVLMTSKLVPIGRLWERLVASITRRPVLCLGMTLYWLWTNMTFQMPVVFGPSELLGAMFPAQIPLLAANIIAYILLITLFVVRRFEFKGRSYLWAICVTMSVGSAFIGCWAFLGKPPLGSALPIASSPGPTVVAASAYLVGSLLAGAASAALCIEMQRVYGSIESESILFHGAASYLVSIAIVSLLSVLPSQVALVIYALVPLPIAYCLAHTQAGLTQRELYGRGRIVDAHKASASEKHPGWSSLRLPYKLLATSLLHGLSLGVLAGSSFYQQDGGTYLTCATICYALSAGLILFAAFSAKLSFDSLIYQVAFPIIALGLYALYAFGGVPAIGTSIQLVGFSFLHLVMWCVCSFLIKSFDTPPTWVIGTSTCAFMVGQLVGSATSCLLVQSPGGEAAYERLVVTTLLVMLGASLLMISNRNLRTGWGLAKPDNMHATGRPVLELVMHQVATDASLTEREASVLLLLGRGRNRQAISDELQISKETAKTHIQSIYRKVGVHSQQELLSLLEMRSSQVEEARQD